MTVEKIPRSISTKVWDQAEIKLMNPGAANRLAIEWATGSSSLDIHIC